MSDKNCDIISNRMSFRSGLHRRHFISTDDSTNESPLETLHLIAPINRLTRIRGNIISTPRIKFK